MDVCPKAATSHHQNLKAFHTPSCSQFGPGQGSYQLHGERSIFLSLALVFSAFRKSLEVITSSPTPLLHFNGPQSLAVPKQQWPLLAQRFSGSEFLGQHS